MKHGFLSWFVAGAAAVLFAGGCGRSIDGKGEGHVGQRHVLLIGASVGKAWELAGLPARTGVRDVTFESIAAYQFDKGDAVSEVLLRPKRRFRLTRTYFKGIFQPAPKVPDTVILKECAAYFPGDLRAYEEMFPRWVKQLRDRGIRVVVATVVPVTREHAAGKAGRVESIREFNDWVRAYAAREGLPLLDLEAVLREEGGERFLAGDCTSGDGLHLNRKAYDRLDRALLEVLGIPPGR